MSKKKKSKIKDEDGNENINFYELAECKVFGTKYNNPSYSLEKMPFKHPFRACLVGASGSGKSNVLLNLISKLNGTFNKILIFTQDKNEQLYNFLESKIDKPFLEIYEGIDAFNNYEIQKELDEKNMQTLIIFDDMCIETKKKQQKIQELFIRGRKMCGQGLSICYLSQSFVDTPILIRKQATHFILKKVNGGMDLRRILKDCSIEANGKQLESMYNYCVSSADNIIDFLLIDRTATEAMRFRKNYAKVLNPSDF